MKDNQKKIMTGLFTAAGAVSAFFGVRALRGWLNRRPEYPYRVQQGKSAEEVGGEHWPPSEYRPQQAHQNQPASMAGQNQPAMGSGPQEIRMPEAGVTSTGRTEVGENYQSTFQDEGERERSTIPETGMMGAPAAEKPRAPEFSQAQTDVVETDQPVPVSSLVGPLIVHLLSFNNMMKMLQMRRDTGSAANPNTPDVRAGGADAVSSLEGQVPQFDRSALVKGSLQERMIQMMDRIREVLQNTDYSEDDLFRINDEMRPAACKALELIHKAGEDNVTGFVDVQKDYGCR